MFHIVYKPRLALALITAGLCLVVSARAQTTTTNTTTPAPTPTPTPAPATGTTTTTPTSSEQTEERPTGLPKVLDWRFNFDAGWGSFGFGNSLFTDPKEGVAVDFGDHWFEGFVKPALSATWKLRSSSEIYGKISAVGERTYSSPPEPIVGSDESSFLPEDLHIGWRSGTSMASLPENALDFTVGRAQYTLGHGLLLWDGAAEGGSRGGYWSNARKAFGFAAIARFKPTHHTAEAFYLKRDSLPENETETGVWGANYEFRPTDSSTFGVTYMKWSADPRLNPFRDGLKVFNLRAYTSPLFISRDVVLEFEYARERNDNFFQSTAWTALGGYTFATVSWEPEITYRYAFFEGDDPATRRRSEAFDPLLPGFYDWGSWWQGEIVGEYFIANSNLISHMGRANVTPSDSLSGGIIFYKFFLDYPSSFAPNVTDTSLASELDLYTDWQVNSNFTASFVLAYAKPHEAVQQAIGRTAPFRYGMVFLAYSY